MHYSSSSTTQHSRFLSSKRAAAVHNGNCPASIHAVSHRRASFHVAVVIWVPQPPLCHHSMPSATLRFPQTKLLHCLLVSRTTITPVSASHRRTSPCSPYVWWYCCIVVGLCNFWEREYHCILPISFTSLFMLPAAVSYTHQMCIRDRRYTKLGIQNANALFFVFYNATFTFSLI
ncbi:hypothetical protein DEO72_LG2g4044 [Vigna unguiculata]|uniref:Uncharacterized protein n=1 Tax=Vigna unguiculata TaxID=3917 RepID=A0A4D6L5A2_VIGUN|nr:hypothetical protein DEO72_LG2g4044 [Vigna unguiculata]